MAVVDVPCIVHMTTLRKLISEFAKSVVFYHRFCYDSKRENLLFQEKEGYEHETINTGGCGSCNACCISVSEKPWRGNRRGQSGEKRLYR